MSDDWDFKVAGWRGPTLLLETVHRGVSSMQMEVDVWKTRMERGEVDAVVITDMRSGWVRAQHGNGPWAKNLSETIRYVPISKRRKPHA